MADVHLIGEIVSAVSSADTRPLPFPSTCFSLRFPVNFLPRLPTHSTLFPHSSLRCLPRRHTLKTPHSLYFPIPGGSGRQLAEQVQIGEMPAPQNPPLLCISSLPFRSILSIQALYRALSSTQSSRNNPQTLKPSNPQTLNPNPSTLNPQPSTLTPKPKVAETCGSLIRTLLHPK
jgi:hypothetical protein